MDPNKFMEWDRKYAEQRIKDTFIPDIKIQNNRTLIFHHEGKDIKIIL